MVAISQRSIPKDQLYENKKDQEALSCNHMYSTQLSFKEFSFKSVYYTLRVKEKALPSHRKIDLHITLGGVNAVIN